MTEISILGLPQSLKRLPDYVYYHAMGKFQCHSSNIQSRREKKKSIIYKIGIESIASEKYPQIRSDIKYTLMQIFSL